MEKVIRLLKARLHSEQQRKSFMESEVIRRKIPPSEQNQLDVIEDFINDLKDSITILTHH